MYFGKMSSTIWSDIWSGIFIIEYEPTDENAPRMVQHPEQCPWQGSSPKGRSAAERLSQSALRSEASEGAAEPFLKHEHLKSAIHA